MDPNALKKRQLLQGQDDDAGDEPQGADEIAIDAVVVARLEKHSVGLMRGWLFACVLPYTFASLSWLGDGEGDEDTPLFVQVLSLDPEVTTTQ